jgi:hypothetical protein
MTVSSPMRRGSAVILAADAVLALCSQGWSQTAPIAPPTAATAEWQTTNRSLLDFVVDGYDLVSVVSPSPQTRLYFLTKPGKIVKCREESAPSSPPPLPPPPPVPGQAGAFPTGRVPTFMPSPEDSTSATSEFECAELSRVLRQ